MPSERNMAKELSQQLKAGNLCCFIGAGVSMDYVDPITGKEYPGISTAKEIVMDLSKKKTYIDSKLSFEQACFLIKANEGRANLVNTILQYVNKSKINPLPAHDLLASMPFSAVLTTNFDCLMEKAYDTANKNYSVIIEDTDMSGWQGYKIPLIKIHGCISRPKTIVAAEDEYQILDIKLPLVASLLKILMSNKTVLFLGYSLDDEDFKRTYSELLHVLGAYMPKSYAVVKNPNDYDITYWDSQELTIINDDLTKFLRDLKSYLGNGVSFVDGNDWRQNSFFSTLSKITTAPSETQAIDAFLNHLSEISVNTSLSCKEILDDADKAVKQILMKKANFEAFRKLWDSLRPQLEECCDDINKFQTIIIEIIDERRDWERIISRKWAEVVQPNDNILIFSQSVRLINLLKMVPPNTQKSVNVYICECRPKSPTLFQDALAICKNLELTHYAKFNLIPDVASGNLIERKKITSIIMGAHSIYWKNDIPVSFVNTCGTSMICAMAEKFEIPVYIITEKEKFVTLKENQVEEVSYGEEENIFNGIKSQLNINPKNIGYDLCKINRHMYDKGLFKIISN